MLKGFRKSSIFLSRFIKYGRCTPRGMINVCLALVCPGYGCYSGHILKYIVYLNVTCAMRINSPKWTLGPFLEDTLHNVHPWVWAMNPPDDFYQQLWLYRAPNVEGRFNFLMASNSGWGGAPTGPDATVDKLQGRWRGVAWVCGWTHGDRLIDLPRDACDVNPTNLTVLGG